MARSAARCCRRSSRRRSQCGHQCDYSERRWKDKQVGIAKDFKRTLARLLAPLPAFAKRMTGTSDQGGCVARALAKSCIFDRTSVACARTIASVERSKRLITQPDSCRPARGSPASPASTLNPCRPAQRLKLCPRFHPAFPFAINAQLTSQRIISERDHVVDGSGSRASPARTSMRKLGAKRRLSLASPDGAADPPRQQAFSRLDCSLGADGRYKCVGSRRKFSRVDCLDNVSMLLSRMTERTPAELGYRMPAEWERHEATWLSWPRREGISFPGSFDRVLPALRAMVAALIKSERVCINVCNGAHEAEAMEVLRDLDPARITFHRIPTNEPWCRDHGPIFLTRNKQPRLAIVDWDYNAWGGKYPPCDLDEVVPTRVARNSGCSGFLPADDFGRRLD